MDLLSPDLLATLAESGPIGVILLLGAAVVLFMRGNLCTGKDLQRVRAERDDWKDIANKAADNVATLVPIIESLAETTEALWEADQAARHESELRRQLKAEGRP
jgi:hypothetical protein